MALMKKYYQILKIEPGVTFEEVKRAYREKVKFWHPDRFPIESPRLQKKAHEQVSQINEAYKGLELLYKKSSGGVDWLTGDFSDSNKRSTVFKFQEDSSPEMIRARQSPSYRTFTWHNGNRFEGETLDNKMHGWGVYFYNNGDRYEGQFFESKPHGTGSLFFLNGDRYEGEFIADSIAGQGIYYHSSGDSYNGTFVNGKPQGRGTLKLSCGSEYCGWWKDGEFLGKDS
jgi:curved DNA-binding protein CbpA